MNRCKMCDTHMVDTEADHFRCSSSCHRCDLLSSRQGTSFQSDSLCGFVNSSLQCRNQFHGSDIRLRRVGLDDTEYNPSRGLRSSNWSWESGENLCSHRTQDVGRDHVSKSQLKAKKIDSKRLQCYNLWKPTSEILIESTNVYFR